MLINEVSKRTGLTKRAIEYYIDQDLIFPTILNNGYRDFNQEDIEQLKKIAILRKLGIGIDDINKVLLDESRNTLQTLALQKELDIQRERAKKSIFDKLSNGISYSEIRAELELIENKKTIIEKILEAFPGYFGRFICLHFARFLNEPIKTESQQVAYDKIISFLDDIPTFNLPDDLQKNLIENTRDIGTLQIQEMINETKKSIENIDDFLSNNKEVLEQYLVYKQSKEYLESPANKLMMYMKEFNSTNGYNDVFIPALKELSPSYAKYYKQLEIANEKLLTEYPEIERLYK